MSNSDFYSDNSRIININIDGTNLSSYQTRVPILAGRTQAHMDRVLMASIYKPTVDENKVDFGKISFNSNERNHVKAGEAPFKFYPGLKAVKFNISPQQQNSDNIIIEVSARVLSKAFKDYDDNLLSGDGKNTGVLSAGNFTKNKSTAIGNIDQLIRVLEDMKAWLGENNMTTNGFKTLIPLSLRSMVESSLSYTISGEQRVFKSLGEEGIDFNYLPSFVMSESQIIMSYSPQVLWIYSWLPQIFGQYEAKGGSIDAHNVYEFGYGATAMISLNKDKAILVQPFTTN